MLEGLLGMRLSRRDVIKAAAAVAVGSGATAVSPAEAGQDFGRPEDYKHKVVVNGVNGAGDDLLIFFTNDQPQQVNEAGQSKLRLTNAWCPHDINRDGTNWYDLVDLGCHEFAQEVKIIPSETVIEIMP